MTSLYSAHKQYYFTRSRRVGNRELRFGIMADHGDWEMGNGKWDYGDLGGMELLLYFYYPLRPLSQKKKKKKGS